MEFKELCNYDWQMKEGRQWIYIVESSLWFISLVTNKGIIEYWYHNRIKLKED